MATRERLPTPYTISPTHDTPFKYMFAQEGESEELLAVFLNHLLTLQDELKIQSLTYHNVEVTSTRSDGRRLILDLRVTANAGSPTTSRSSARTPRPSSVAPSFSRAASPAISSASASALMN